MKDTYFFYHDGGHGWLAVPIEDLIESGVADQISNYSYEAAGTVYLEEDCDAGRFLDARRAKLGTEAKVLEHYDGTYSMIRNYARYTKREGKEAAIA